ncbi:triple functional domain protein-like isoform X2 [Hyalella azteca]|uniref:Triple functional domain protein-like isoform X2 n=1 Tax=Hyalella azteca TaxID=294128 RepID=A0A979FTF4_HYAAZ|nr:triple functional domain protein-like isoform X2 [Hyalella azteca]
MEFTTELANDPNEGEQDYKANDARLSDCNDLNLTPAKDTSHLSVARDNHFIQPQRRNRCSATAVSNERSEPKYEKSTVTELSELSCLLRKLSENKAASSKQIYTQNRELENHRNASEMCKDYLQLSSVNRPLFEKMFCDIGSVSSFSECSSSDAEYYDILKEERSFLRGKMIRDEHSFNFGIECVERKERPLTSVSWVLQTGEETLQQMQLLQTGVQTLAAANKNLLEFKQFYRLAERHLDNGCCALDEPRVGAESSTHDASVRALAGALKLHVTLFNKRLLLAKEAFEDTARCYNLLDKTYEWALETMRVVNRVKTVGVASPDQVGAAAQSLAAHAQRHPPPSADTFANMVSLATKLGNATLLQQVKMGESRCQETLSLLQSRQAALVKARRQMEFDCQSFVDLNEVLDSDDPSPFSWLIGTPLNSSGRRRSSSASTASKSRETLSRCSSLDIEDDGMLVEAKQPLEGRSSLGGIKEVRESVEELDRDLNARNDSMSFSKAVSNAIESLDPLSSSNPHTKLSSTFNSRDLSSGFVMSPIHNQSQSLNLASLPASMSNNANGNKPTRNRYLSSTDSSNSSGGSNSSCGSRGSDQIAITQRAANHKSLQRASAWPYGAALDDAQLQPHHDSLMEDEDEEELLEESGFGGSDEVREERVGSLVLPPSSANSHLLTRSSQLDITGQSFVEGDAKKNIKLCHIMSELIKTEQDYVLSLEYIIENYLPELLREDIPQALRGQRNVIFGNIEKIHEFHRGYFLKHLKQCERKPLDIGRIFLKYERQFYLYALYNKNKPKSDELMAEYGSVFFRKKQLEIGDKMDLASYLLKPVQRMGKYALLLTQLVQLTTGSEACHQLTEAQQMVQFQLRHGNDLLAMDSLKDCDVNLKEQGQLLRQAEFLVCEGSRGRKTPRHVFLFEDLILFSKARKDPEKKNLDIFQYKHSMKMTDIGLTAQLDSGYKFEIWFRKRKPSDTYVLQASSLEVKEAWTEEISKLLWRQALRNRTLRQHEMSSMGIGNKPCLDIRPSEDQINDRSVSVACKQPVRPRLEASMSVDSATSSANNSNSSHGNSALRRPYSIISVSSSSSSNASSQPSSSSCGGTGQPFVAGTINLGFESGNSPRPLHRSVTRTSQCSAESGIMADMYPADQYDSSLHHNSLHQSLYSHSQSHFRVERSNSTVTSVSIDSGLSPTSPSNHSPASYSASSSTSPSTGSSDMLSVNNTQEEDASDLNNDILSSLASVSIVESSRKTVDKIENFTALTSEAASNCHSTSSSSSLAGETNEERAAEINDYTTLDAEGVKTLLTTEV